MSELNELLRDTTARLFGDVCTRSEQERAQEGIWPAAVWDAAVASGLCSALDPESEEPVLLPWDTLGTIVRSTGEFAVPLPLPETLLAQSALTRAGLRFPEGPLSIAADVKCAYLRKEGGEWVFSGRLLGVPWGRDAQAIVLFAESAEGPRIIRLARSQPARLGMNLANEPRDDFDLVSVSLADTAVSAPLKEDIHLSAEAALFRCLQMSGAMHRCLEMTVQYAMERVQFGRPIGKFQAVQHMVAVLAGETAAATAATEAAVYAVSERSALFDIHAAKVRASEAAGICQALAHQVHAAMGTTYEYSLHFYTRRLMSWRDEYGSEAECAEWIGRQVHASGGTKLWQLITTPGAAESEAGIPRMEALNA